MTRDGRSLITALAGIVGARHVRTALPERITYARDGLPTHRRVPGVVVLPGSRDEVIAIVRLLAALGVPFVPRGAGTGLSAKCERRCIAGADCALPAARNGEGLRTGPPAGERYTPYDEQP